MRSLHVLSPEAAVELLEIVADSPLHEGDQEQLTVVINHMVTMEGPIRTEANAMGKAKNQT